MDTKQVVEDLIKGHQEKIAEGIMKSTVLTRTSDRLKLLQELGITLLPAHTFVLVDVTFAHPYLSDTEKKVQVQNKLNQLRADNITDTRVIGVSPDGGFQVGNG